MSAGSSTLFSGGAQGQNSRALLRVIILVLIAGAAVASRLFSVIRESTRLAHWAGPGKISYATLKAFPSCPGNQWAIVNGVIVNGSVMLTVIFMQVSRVLSMNVSTNTTSHLTPQPFADLPLKLHNNDY